MSYLKHTQIIVVMYLCSVLNIGASQPSDIAMTEAQSSMSDYPMEQSTLFTGTGAELPSISSEERLELERAEKKRQLEREEAARLLKQKQQEEEALEYLQTQRETTQALEAAQALENIKKLESSKTQKSVAGEITQALLDAQGTKTAAAKILQIAAQTLTKLLNGEESTQTKLKILELFKKARTAGTLATEWKLSVETIKRLSELVDKKTA